MLLVWILAENSGNSVGADMDENTELCCEADIQMDTEAYWNLDFFQEFHFIIDIATIHLAKYGVHTWISRHISVMDMSCWRTRI